MNADIDYRHMTIIRFVRKPEKPKSIFADLSIDDFPEICHQELSIGEAIEMHMALGRAIAAAEK